MSKKPLAVNLRTSTIFVPAGHDIIIVLNSIYIMPKRRVLHIRVILIYSDDQYQNLPARQMSYTVIYHTIKHVMPRIIFILEAQFHPKT